MQRDVLHNLLLLVHLSLRDGHILLRLQIKLSRVGIAPADPLHGARVGLDVDDVSDSYALFLYTLVDTWVKAQLLGSFGGLEADNNVRDSFSVAAERVFGLLGGEVCDFAFVDFLRFLYPKSWIGGGGGLSANPTVDRARCGEAYQ